MKLAALLFSAAAGLSATSATATASSFNPTIDRGSMQERSHDPAIDPKPRAQSRALRQATRASVIRSLQKGPARRQTSAGTYVCIPDTTPATSTPRYADFPNTGAYNTGNDNFLGDLGPASNDYSCAKLCDATTNCVWAITFSGDCYGYSSNPSESVSTGAFDALYQNADCASVKAEVPALANNDCCNLYYSS